MIPIFILSIIAVYIFCERYMLLRKYTRISDTFPDKIRDCIFAGNIRGAVTVCNEENTPMSGMLVKGLLHYRLPVTELRAIVESAANLEVAGMEKGLSTLATCAGMAPMIGLPVIKNDVTGVITERIMPQGIPTLNTAKIRHALMTGPVI